MKENPRNKRSEEIQDIVDRMPTKFGTVVTIIILGLVTITLILGWTIDYPDSVRGSISISAEYSPVKLVANSSGKLQILNYHPKSIVKEGDYIGYIQNPANVKSVQELVTILDSFQVNDQSVLKSYPLFPTKVSLGDLDVKYYTFLNSLQQIYNYQIGNVYSKQEINYKHQLSELTSLLKNDLQLSATRKSNMDLAKRIYVRDSILNQQKALADEDADHSKITFLTSKENYQSIQNDIKSVQQQIDDTESKLQQLYIQKNDKEKQMHLDMLSAYNELKGNIKSWEQLYVFKAPISGQVDFSKFWTNNEYIQSGDDVFTVLPPENKIIGQTELPAQGAGKVNIGQEVIVKLDNYPYEEYGSVKGIVKSVSLISNPEKVNQETLDMYRIEIELPEALKTNYNSKLQFKYQIKGTADIVTSKRNLLQRLFDNLRYVTDKN